MGSLSVKALDSRQERELYFQRLLTDIEALERMTEEGLFEKEPIRIGAEQEFCLVDEHWEPSRKAVEILEAIDEPHFTSELTLYNLEVNLDPKVLSGTCFSEMHKELNGYLDHAQEVADTFGDKIILTGILPTIRTKNVSEAYMTPLKRYKTLSDTIRQIRDTDLELKIKGVDEINLHHDTIMYEGCNTSFQAHLQIDPDDFADTYNWSQAIAGPLLSICANSPMLMGRELWDETRIALFTQSVDTRKSTFLLNKREPRVGFGFKWASGTPADFFKETIVRFRSLISTEFGPKDSLEQLDEGTIPKLEALNLHNGTVYPWNRLCYGAAKGKPHLRIENRYMPSGPTTSDEMANLAFWAGVMMGRPAEWKNIHEKMDFRDAKKNFFNAARYGMAAQFHWDGKIIPTRNLLLEFFLPMAYRGLALMGVDRKDAEHYLKIIENRINAHNGSEWMIQTYRSLLENLNPPEALRKLTACLFHRSFKGYPVDAWKHYCASDYRAENERIKVGDLMSSRIITAQDGDSAALVVKIMEWNGFHHLPVLNDSNDLCGLLSWSDVEPHVRNTDLYTKQISDLMQTELVTISRDALAEDARELMYKHKIHCLPVVEGTHLIGILTNHDFKD